VVAAAAAAVAAAGVCVFFLRGGRHYLDNVSAAGSM